ncbi:hypothetical protein I6F36_21200 [Bradyrhizobium sp. BRP19]|uniref:hypothetical protein n=1 Tax=Bradyrhizobium sp. BRP19 TaxID=2793823 RepID=UPI001CD6E2C5|nr:hypothetical protein [Bradyrhizobium sp. BRP19]MCA1549351.1 hypothetical protein [Bradyrhizobium sp. BRP19]
MTDNTEMAPLKRAYLSALAARGREAADRALQPYTNGARGPHAWRKVAEADVAKAVATLEQLTFHGDGGQAKTESRLRTIANAAYGREQPKPPRELDPVAIFERWNNPPMANRSE